MSIKNRYNYVRELFSRIWLAVKRQDVSGLNRQHKKHAAAIALAAGVLLWLGWTVFVPAPALEGGSSAPVTIAQGQGLYGIANTLKSQGLIRSTTSFVLYVTLRGWERKLKAGDYDIPAGSNLFQVAGEIIQGTGSRDVGVLIPEGSNIWQVDRKLTEAGFSYGTIFAKKYYLQDGKFFPDTYRFSVGTTADEAAKKMQQNFVDRTQALLGNIAPAQLDRIIIIASILEKEARTENDMRLVSGVIRNRLAKKIPLQIDATVAYGACARQYAANPVRDCQVNLIPVGTEIHVDSPFNSYTRPGLPPRPISNPGLAAIEAAINPTGDYLYYLSPRGGGDLIFSRTAAEHAANRAKYLGL